MVYADLAAGRSTASSKVIAAEQAGRQIVVEIKSFTGPSVIQDFKMALGQYRMYLLLLSELVPDHKLYLAISHMTYVTAFKRQIIQFVVQQDEIPLIVVDIYSEEIVEWIR